MLLSRLQIVDASLGVEVLSPCQDSLVVNAKFCWWRRIWAFFCHGFNICRIHNKQSPATAKSVLAESDAMKDLRPFDRKQVDRLDKHEDNSLGTSNATLFQGNSSHNLGDKIKDELRRQIGTDDQPPC